MARLHHVSFNGLSRSEIMLIGFNFNLIPQLSYWTENVQLVKKADINGIEILGLTYLAYLIVKPDSVVKTGFKK